MVTRCCSFGHFEAIVINYNESSGRMHSIEYHGEKGSKVIRARTGGHYNSAFIDFVVQNDSKFGIEGECRKGTINDPVWELIDMEREIVFKGVNKSKLVIPTELLG